MFISTSSNKSKFRNLGENQAVAPTVNSVIVPPKTTAVTVPINFAVTPLSKAPNSLDEPTNMVFRRLPFRAYDPGFLIVEWFAE